MGARYLLIEFDDEAMASRLRAQIDNATRSGKKFRVVGLFAKPTGYCQCDPKIHTTRRGTIAKLKRGKKFGWAVCTACGRPTPSLSSLVNLIRPRDIIDPVKWMSKHWQGLADFEAMHYISALSGTIWGPQIFEYHDKWRS